MAIFQGLNDEGKTVVLVTHEEDIAAHCKRILRFKTASSSATRRSPTDASLPRSSEPISPGPGTE